eukprot:COSAG01_NODE_5016_length_4541_cov_18.957902_2_plen_279_part_00
MAERTTNVRFSNPDGCQLAGILVEPESWAAADAQQKWVVVLLHGLYQHKNINMLRPFGTRIPDELGMASFRFDGRGLGQSEGVTSFAPHYNSLCDLESAVSYLQDERGLSVYGIVGYSAGGNVAAMFAAEHPLAVRWISIHSSRFRMEGIKATLEPAQLEALRVGDSFEYRFSRRGVEQAIEVDEAAVSLFARTDMASYCRRIPAATRVLCTHGLGDVRVPPTDSAGYVSNIANAQQHLLAAPVGHDYAEEGATEELWTALLDFLRSEEWRSAVFSRM